MLQTPLPGQSVKNLPSLLPYLTTLANEMYRTGFIPFRLRSIYAVPLPKAGKNPKDPINKRPISLLNVLSKILEATVLYRIMMDLEGCWER